VSRESVLFGIAGVFFGLLVGWIVGSQQSPAPRVQEAAPVAQQAPQPPGRQSAPFDEARAATLRQQAAQNPRDARVRLDLGNAYFDSERFADAARWYEEALTLEPRNVNASTDLGISYYYMNQPDRALQQFERSLEIDPLHTKTLLNVGIVRAYGKEDLDGAVKAWQRVVEIQPDSPEGKVARQALDAVRNSHPNVSGGSGRPPG
jgi:tetratricopeptide (TPR) repeat protein